MKIARATIGRMLAVLLACMLGTANVLAAKSDDVFSTTPRPVLVLKASAIAYMSGFISRRRSCARQVRSAPCTAAISSR